MQVYFKIVVLTVFFLKMFSVSAQEYIRLWNDGEMPNTKGLPLDHIEARERVTQVKTPGMYSFLTSKEENTGAAILIFPPGGYAKLTYNIAGFQLAKWFNTIGINAFVVMYRLPTSPDLEIRQLGPIEDAQRAMKIVRANADKWGLDSTKIGVMGCSAGGHLAANLCTISTDFSSINDSLDAYSTKPDFQILISAALSMGEYGHKGSRNNLLGNNPSDKLVEQFSNELHVAPNCAPVFIALAANDPVVSPMNSMLYYEAMLKNKVQGCCLHVFPEGGHSIALRNNPGSTNLWTGLCEAWLIRTGVIPPNFK